MNQPQPLNKGSLIKGTLYLEVSESCLSNHYNQWAKYYRQLSKDIAIFASKDSNTISFNLDYYCGYNYSIINQHLRKETSSEYTPWIERAHLLQLTIFYAPRMPENLIAYRGVDESFTDRFFLNTDRVAIEKGFLSTSISALVAKEFSKNNSLLKIFIKSGTPGIYVDAIFSRNEYELLFPPNSMLKLISEPYYDKEISAKIFECILFY